ncbi:unnamed protein product [marine sediment metagenome]|uniref:Uncharacterized protein n=1 Tax=marine sediment metagenome TaxID=412755 RepID=X0SJ12_9ZZZZ
MLVKQRKTERTYILEIATRDNIEKCCNVKDLRGYELVAMAGPRCGYYSLVFKKKSCTQDCTCQHIKDTDES